MARIDRAAKPKSTTILFGNHEDRLPRYITDKAPELARSVTARELLCLPDKMKVVPYGQGGFVRAGKLLLTHGTVHSKHASASMLDVYRHSVIFGHTHRVSEHQVTGVGGEPHRAINLGWLGDAKKAAPYVKDVANWSQAFAMVYVLSNGDWHCQVAHVVNGRCMLGSRLYQARC